MGLHASQAKPFPIAGAYERMVTEQCNRHALDQVEGKVLLSPGFRCFYLVNAPASKNLTTPEVLLKKGGYQPLFRGMHVKKLGQPSDERVQLEE